MKRNRKVFLALLLALSLMVTMTPMVAMADEGPSGDDPTSEELTQMSVEESGSKCIQKGSITIEKELADGSDPGAPDVFFNFTVSKKTSNSGRGSWEVVTTAAIKANDSIEIDQLPYDDYKVEEILIPENFASVGPTEKKVEIDSNNKNVTVTFQNKYTAPEPPVTTPGSLSITKDVYDSHENLINGEVDGLFHVTITGDESTGGYTTEVAISAGEEITLSNLTPGNYSISESAIDNYAIPSASDIDIVAGVAAEFTIANMYLLEEPDPDPEFVMTKSVAVYSGNEIPANEAFSQSLALDELDKEVIFKIEIDLEQETDVRISEATTPMYRIDDLLQSHDGSASVVNDLLMEDQDGDLVSAASIINGFPEYLHIGSGLTFYYIDTCEDEGTYTNTAELYTFCESQVLNSDTSRITENEDCGDLVASASAVVIVDLPEDPGDDDPTYNPPSSRDYNNVTYKANFPTGVVTSGSVPTDSSNYSDGGTVTVKDNSGTLTAEGYTFLGWDTLADGSGTDYVSADTFKIYNDVTLYAQWDPATEESTPSVETGTTPADPSTAVTGESNDLDPVPKTGDNTPIMALTLLGLLSAGAAIYLMRRREA